MMRPKAIRITIEITDRDTLEAYEEIDGNILFDDLGIDEAWGALLVSRENSLEEKPCTKWP